MLKMSRTAMLFAFSASVAGCAGKEAQTRESVITKTSGGEASTSISGDSADKRGEALVRVVNAVPGTHGLGVRTDADRTFGNVDYKGVTSYRPIDKTWTKFEVMSAAGSAYAPLTTNREMLADGHRYSVVVMKKDDGSFDTRILRDEIATDPVKAQLRVIHAAPETKEIDVYQKGGVQVFEGVDFSSEAGFKALDPWNGTLEIRSESGKKVLYTIPGVKLEAGKSYSIVLTRGADGKLDAFWFEDHQAM